jgi:leucyl aminopeptidase
VLGAHLDSINASNRNDPNQLAPGADDDASGIATLTETLRIALSEGWRPRRTVKFMGYAAEEVGLRGSNAIAQSFRSSGVNVVGVLQVDMTNYKSGAVPDMKLISDYSNADLKNFFVTLFDTYLAPRGLTRGSEACGYACSDHASWTNAGYPAAMMFEAGSPSGSFPYIHTTNDTLATMGESAQHSVKFAQFALAYLAETAKTAQTRVTGGPAPVLREGG